MRSPTIQNPKLEGGFIASLARPGGNGTGLSSVRGELGGKLLEVLKEIMPRLTRVVIPGPAPGSSTQDLFIEGNRDSRPRSQSSTHSSFGARASRLQSSFSNRGQERSTGARRTNPAKYSPNQRRQFVELSAQHRLPAIYQATNWIDSGGLVSYGADRNYQFQRAAVYVDKILKGTKPADLPVEQPMKFEFIINLKATKQIALTIPPQVLARANRVIR